MKIVMLDPANLTPFYCYALSDALANCGNEVIFISTAYDNDSKIKPPEKVVFLDHYFRRFRKIQTGKIKKLRQLVRGLHYFPDHWRTLRKIKKQKPDVLHIQWAMLPKIDIWLVKQVQKLGIPVVLTIHDVNPLFNHQGDDALSILYNQVDSLIVHYTDAIQILEKRFKVKDSKKVFVVPHGPLQSENIPKNATRTSARNELSILGNYLVILFFGEIKHYKGLDILVEAVKTVKATHENIYLLVAGKPGSQSDIPDLSQLVTLDIHHNANFSFIPNDDVWKYYLAANLVVLPYRDIGQSGVLFSSIAHKRFVLSTAVGGLPQLIGDIGGGRTVEKENVRTLAESINDLLHSPHDLDIEASTACERLFSNYSWNSISERTIKVYKKYKGE